MLETKELVKIYKPKKGVPVTALNKISLKFPEKGMVFLLAAVNPPCLTCLADLINTTAAK